MLGASGRGVDEFGNGSRGGICGACSTELFSGGDATAAVPHQLVFLAYILYRADWDVSV